jgi:undecaprenyl-diphosphatase
MDFVLHLRLVTRRLFESNHRVPNWIAVIILGIIEGVTEFLPVSSTGHLLLAEQWLPEQTDLFNTVVQCGAVLAVLVVFAARVRQLLSTWRQPASRDYLLKLAAAFCITAAGGLVVKHLGWKLPHETAPVAWATLLGGVFFVIVEIWLRGSAQYTEVTWLVALAVGGAQLVAGIFPGASRSGTTILISLILGLARPAATEFSFLLGIPTLLSAGAYEMLSAVRHHQVENEKWSLVALGTTVAAATAFVAVKWLLRYVQTHTFVVFGWYRLVLGALILIWGRS